MSDKAGTIEIVVRNSISFLDPLINSLDLNGIKVFLQLELNTDLPDEVFQNELLGNHIDQCKNSIALLFELVNELDLAIEAEDYILIIAKSEDAIFQIKNIIQAIGLLGEQINILSNTLEYPLSSQLSSYITKFAVRTIDLLVAIYINKHLIRFETLDLLGLLELNTVSIGTNPAKEIIQEKISLNKLSNIISHPLDHFKSIYKWGEADFLGEVLLMRLSKWLIKNNIPVVFTPSSTNQEAFIDFDLFSVHNYKNDTIHGISFVHKLPIPDEFTIQYSLSKLWKLKLIVDGGFDGNFEWLLLPSGEISILTSNQTLNPRILLNIVGQDTDPNETITLIGLGGGKGNVSVSKIDCSFSFDCQVGGDETLGSIDFKVEINLSGGQIQLSIPEEDSFLSSIMKANSYNSAFDITLSWGLRQGLNIKGSGGLSFQIPTVQAIGPVELEHLFFEFLFGNEDQDFSIETSTGLRAKLGPLTLTIDRIGLKADLTFPDNNSGNLGPLDLDIGFKPPTGIGLVIDGGGFKGGGFLRFEPEAARYTGVLELEFKDKIALKAIGLLETRLPNNQPGYTLLILITAEFTPVQLGFGFTLNGVGGLLGLHRMVDIERLRTGIRDNTLSNILFPQNIVENAERIISDLRQVFPPQEGRFVFGPMARIGWGSPTILTIDLGLLIEVPNPVRMAILGVLKGILPKEEAPVLRLQVNFLGEINLEKQQLSFDASLYDSKLLAFTLTGDMAIRLYWGDDPNFLLTVGGFHPAYQPPPMNLPDIRRITLALTEGDNPRLRLETYFAVTSNTVQFGAKAELYASAWKFNVSGFISFDVLFQFSPFRFIAEVSAMLALSVGSSPFASIQLAFALEGPTPWSAKGTASFKICWFFTLKIRFSKTWGESRNESLPDVAVMPLLLAAMNDNNNWVAELPRGRHLLVSTKEVVPAAGGGQNIIAQPYGVLNISQKVVPLNLSIQKFGNLRPADGNLFKISGVQVGENMSIVNPEAAREFFAPAQFFEKSDAEKLSDKSFERYDSGIRLSENGQLKSDYATARKVKYEVNYIDSQLNQRLSKPDKELFQPDVGAFNTWALQGAISKSDLSHAHNRKPALAPGAVSLAQERFGVVNSGDLSLFDSDSLALSEAEARAKIDNLVAANPTLRGRLQMLPVFELNP